MSKPMCRTKGIMSPGAACGSMIVGTKECGYNGKCIHQEARVVKIKIDEKWSVSHDNGKDFVCYRYDELKPFELDNLHFAMTQEIENLRRVLWVLKEHDRLHFGDNHSTVIQATEALKHHNER